jgi:hypothetical protein
MTWSDALFDNTPYIRNSDPCLIGDRSGNYYATLLNYDDIGDSSLIVVWKSTDGGESWHGPEPVNDDPKGPNIDQFHPWLVVNEDGVVVLIFYDQRTDPVDHYKFDAFFAASFDGRV